MSDLIKHRMLQTWRKTCAHLEPLSATNDAYIMDRSGTTLVLRAVFAGEAEKLGMKGVDAQIAFAMANRIANMPAVEDAAIALQRDKAILRRELAALMEHLKYKTLPPDRLIAKAAMTMRETE